MTGDDPRPIRVAIADDHPIFRDGLRRLLEIEADLMVIGEASNAEAAFELAVAAKPDVLLLDLAMPETSGIQALGTMPEFTRATRVIVLAAAIDKEDMVRALVRGARGIVLKESATAVLIEAIRVVMSGRYWVVREPVADIMVTISDLQTGIANRQAPHEFGLTEREREIVGLIVGAAGNKEVADLLGISEKTVKAHLTNIFDKLGVSSRVELAVFAIRHGLHT